MRFYLASLACAWAIGLALPAQAQRAHSRDPFHDVASLNARLAALHAAHPSTTRIVKIATTGRGDVLALEVDPDGQFAADAPALFIQGGIHGNEWISTEVVLRLAELVSDGRPRWRGLTYRLVPVINVDGFATGSRKALDPAGAPFDANRDFPVPGQGDHVSQPLIAALRDYVRTGKVVAVLDYHSAAECMLWPFAYDKAAAPPDVDAIAAITAQMASAVGFCSGQVAKVISYKHQGTASDWYQDALGVPAILVELGSVEDPGSQAVEQILIDQERPFGLFLDWLEARGTKAAVAVPASGCRDVTITVGEAPLGYQASGQACDGQRHGAWAFRYIDGGLMREGAYERGKEHGTWRTYHPGGQPHDVGGFVAGTPDGDWKRYAATGTVIEERRYAAGSREGALSRWTDDGALWQVRACAGGMCKTQCKTTGKTTCEAILAKAARPDRHAKRPASRATRAKPTRAKPAVVRKPPAAKRKKPTATPAS